MVCNNFLILALFVAVREDEHFSYGEGTEEGTCHAHMFKSDVFEVNRWSSNVTVRIKLVLKRTVVARRL